MNQFESFPNELIYLIFKYLNANDIFNGLSNLNRRFDALLGAYMDYKVDFRYVRKNVYDFVCAQMNPNHVQTLYLSNKRYSCGQIENFFNRFPLVSFSSRLRSLSLKCCFDNHCKEIINQLPHLTNLTSFSFVANAGANISYESRRQLVEIIARLPFLQRCTVKIYNDELAFDIYGLVFQSVTYLCLGISSLDQIVHLCRRAPNLKHLIIDAVIDAPLSVDDCSALGNLTHLSMRTDANMQELQQLLTKARSLVYLSLGCSNFDCRDGNRWQQILSTINLSKFRFIFFTDPMEAQGPLIDPFNDKFWLERGWYFRYEQQDLNGCIDLYTIPSLDLTYRLNVTDICTVAMTKNMDSAETFQSIRELIYIAYEPKASNGNNYFFPHIEKLVVEGDTLPSSSLLSFQHIIELEFYTALTPYMLDNISMPLLTRLVLRALPTTWTIPSLNGRIKCLKLRTTTSLTDQEVEEMCAPTSFAIDCTHISLTVESRQSVGLVLNQLIYLESVDFLCSSSAIVSNLGIAENWVREKTNIRNFLLTIDTENDRLGLWIGRSN